MAVYATQRMGYAEDERRRRQAALQGQAQPAQYGTGFFRPSGEGIMVEPQTQTGRAPYSLSDFARYAQLRGQFEGRVQPGRRYGQTQGRRYGQTQGMGRGYVPPRRAIGGWQQPYGQQAMRPNYYGYAPQTAGMYGGRPTGQQAYGYGYPTNQQAAMMRPQYSYGAQVRQPWGGYRAVPYGYVGR